MAKFSHTRYRPNVGPGADAGVHAVSPQVILSHPPDGRLPLIFARHAVTSVLELEYHYLYVCINSSDDQAASDINLVGF